jgi:hypothetical protein
VFSLVHRKYTMNKFVLQTEITMGVIAAAQYHVKIASNGVTAVDERLFATLAVFHKWWLPCSGWRPCRRRIGLKGDAMRCDVVIGQ